MRFGLVLALLVAGVGCAASGEDVAQSEGDLATVACMPTLACAAPPLAVERHLWRHWIETPALVTTDVTTGLPSPPNHRGRDLFVNPGAPQTVIGHFAYGITDTFLPDEDVDIFVQRDCASGWEQLGTATTTRAGQPHPTVEGVEDNGGRVYFEIPEAQRLGPGRHRVRMVVRGDGSSTDLFIDVVPPQTPIFVSDVDGTLTSSENIEFAALLAGVLPATHPSAPEALQALAAKGYRPLYLTARPEWLVERTRAFLDEHGFPPGIIHTTTWELGTLAADGAAPFKTDELAMLRAKGLVPAFGFGNKPTDSQAYGTAIPDLNNRFFYRISGDFTGRKINDYGELLPQFGRVAPVCQR